jgi:4-hydroxy-3-methylbut-2-en-1-yl diphosphate reductase
MQEKQVLQDNPLSFELKPDGFCVEEVLVAGDRGPCGGVIRAINATEEVLETIKHVNEKTGISIPVYANHEIVHNALVARELFEKGLRIQPDPNKVNENEIYILSAHGTKPSEIQKLINRGIWVLNAECQLVTADRTRARKILANGKDLAYIGNPNHPEPKAVIGDLDANRVRLIDYRKSPEEMDFPDRPFEVLTQTTLSRRQNIEKVERWSDLNPERDRVVFKDGPCIATDNRQDSLHDIFDIPGKQIDMAIVVGSATSQNTLELQKLAERSLMERGGISIRVDNLEELLLNNRLFTPEIRRIALTSGASVPDKFTVPVLQWLQNNGAIVRVTDPREKYGSFEPPRKDIEAIKTQIYETYGIAA